MSADRGSRPKIARPGPRVRFPCLLASAHECRPRANRAVPIVFRFFAGRAVFVCARHRPARRALFLPWPARWRLTARACPAPPSCFFDVPACRLRSLACRPGGGLHSCDGKAPVRPGHTRAFLRSWPGKFSAGQSTVTARRAPPAGPVPPSSRPALPTGHPATLPARLRPCAGAPRPASADSRRPRG